MEINWIYLVIAILLLWIPAPFFYPEEAKGRLVSNVYAFDYNLFNYLGAWQNWLDGIRAFAGAFCLIHLAVFPDDTVENTRHLVLGFNAGVLGIAAVLQTVHKNRIVFFVAPMFYLWGVTLVLSDWVLGVYAIVAGLCASVMSNSLDLKLWITAGVLAVFGYMLKGVELNVALNVILVIIPLALAYSCNNHLVALTAYSEPEDEDDEYDEENEEELENES
jgi:hypothetical protein